MQSNRTIFLCVCVLLTSSSFGSGVENNNFNSRKISFKLYEKYLIVVQGSLGELKKKNLLIDTGTNPTIIDRSIAKQLQLAPITGTPDTLPVITGDVSAKWSVLPALQVGPVHRESIRVVVEDLSPFSEMVGARIDALVGLDVLGQSSFQIDYNRKEIVFGPVEFAGPSVRFGSEPPFVIVPMSIGKRQVNVLLDTGTSGVVLFARRLGTWPRGLAQVGIATSTGLAGPTTYLSVAQVNDAKIGDQDVGVRQVYLSNRPQCCSFDGLMGITSARMKQIGFDFEHGIFSWQLQSDAIPTMSEARSDSCLPASAPGLIPRSEASVERGSSDLSGCGVAPYTMFPQQRR